MREVLGRDTRWLHLFIDRIERNLCPHRITALENRPLRALARTKGVIMHDLNARWNPYITDICA